MCKTRSGTYREQADGKGQDADECVERGEVQLIGNNLKSSHHASSQLGPGILPSSLLLHVHILYKDNYFILRFHTTY